MLAIFTSYMVLFLYHVSVFPSLQILNGELLFYRCKKIPLSVYPRQAFIQWTLSLNISNSMISEARVTRLANGVILMVGHHSHPDD